MPMWALRLILILAGIAFVAGVYFYTRRHPPRSRREDPSRRAEPTVSIDGPQRPVTRPVEAPHRAAPERSDPSGEPQPTPAEGARRVEPGTTVRPERDNRPEKNPVSKSEEEVFAIGLRLPDEGIPAARVLRELERLGLSLDDRHIFQQAGSGGDPVFSVANMFEPGVLAPLPPDARLRGLSFFFMALPSTATGGRFDRMLGAAQECARAWGGQLEDTNHRPLTAARELKLKLAAVGARSD